MSEAKADGLLRAEVDLLLVPHLVLDPFAQSRRTPIGLFTVGLGEGFDVDVEHPVHRFLPLPVFGAELTARAVEGDGTGMKHELTVGHHDAVVARQIDEARHGASLSIIDDGDGSRVGADGVVDRHALDPASAARF